MPLDSSIPLQSMAPSPMVSLNSMLDMGSKSLSLQKNRATFDADVARTKAESSTAESGAEVNRANIQPLIRQQAAQTSSAQSKAQVDQANVNPLIQQQAAQTANAQTGAQNSAVDLNTKKNQNAAQAAQALMQDPNLNAEPGQPYSVEQGQKTVRGVLRYMEDTGQDQDKIEKMRGPLNEAVKTQGGVVGWLKGQLRTGLTPQQNSGLQNPETSYVDDNATKTPVIRDGMNPQYNSAQARARVVNKPGPTQETINPAGQKGIIGAAQAQPGDLGYSAPAPGMPTNERDAAISRATSDLSKIEQEASNPQKRNPVQMQALNEAYSRAQTELKQAQAMPASDPRFPNAIATGMKPGQGESIAATQKGINDHYRGLQDGAANAAQDIGVLQNIISHAKGASTGVGSEKTALAQAIFGRLGITKAQESTLDYDLLGKNAAMIQLAGGDTNLAKTLAGAANPNSHMSEEAIRQAAHQIIGQKKMSLEGLKLFTPLKALSDGGHMEAYGSMLPKYLANADPRVLQLSGMSDVEKSKMKSAMSPDEAKAFGNKIRMLDSFGIKP